MSARGATALRGILAIDKPAGLTSHDVVARIRRATGEGRVGHAGTLDPAATGLLVVLVGPYTRLEPYLSGATKSYEARIEFGSATDTDDADGSVTDEAPVPIACADPAHAMDILAGFEGPSMQTPPAYSAIKVGGRTAHSAARAGAALDLAPRPIEVHEARLLGIAPDGRWWDVAFTVSKGTYVRALARDVGRACGTFAHLAALRRTSAGALSIASARPLAEVERAIAAGHFDDVLVDPTAALGIPVVEAPAGAGREGARMPAPVGLEPVEGAVVAVTRGGTFAGVYRSHNGELVPEAVMPQAGTR